jgi:hypothetical protein
MSSEYLHKRVGGRAGKMRLAHHLVWEKEYGPIEKGYQIHHLDGNKKNNDLENLAKVTTSTHQRIHSPHFGLLNGEWMRICTDCRRIGVTTKRPCCDECRARRARIERRTKKELK